MHQKGMKYDDGSRWNLQRNSLQTQALTLLIEIGGVSTAILFSFSYSKNIFRHELVRLHQAVRFWDHEQWTATGIDVFQGNPARDGTLGSIQVKVRHVRVS